MSTSKRKIPVVDPAGEYAAFVVSAFAAFRHLPKFTAEVLRQIGMLVAGSALVVIFICFIAGVSCGVAAESIGQAIGASVTGPIFSSFCVNREIVPFLFGFILAAKVGGGIVAQLGAMRVNQEVDAMEIIGIPSLAFMVSTRMRRLGDRAADPVPDLARGGRGRLVARLLRAKSDRVAGHVGVRLLHGHEPQRHPVLVHQGAW